MRRLLWAGVGVAATVLVPRVIRAVTEQHVPAAARGAVGLVGRLASTVEAVRREFTAGMAQREAELRADLLAGADLTRSRQTVDDWRAERSGSAPTEASTGGTGGGTPPTPAWPSTGAHRLQDPDDGPLGYSF